MKLWYISVLLTLLAHEEVSSATQKGFSSEDHKDDLHANLLLESDRDEQANEEILLRSKRETAQWQNCTSENALVNLKFVIKEL